MGGRNIFDSALVEVPCFVDIGRVEESAREAGIGNGTNRRVCQEQTTVLKCVSISEKPDNLN